LRLTENLSILLRGVGRRGRSEGDGEVEEGDGEVLTTVSEFRRKGEGGKEGKSGSQYHKIQNKLASRLSFVRTRSFLCLSVIHVLLLHQGRLVLYLFSFFRYHLRVLQSSFSPFSTCIICGGLVICFPSHGVFFDVL
jgi:hypothetical protein